MIPSSYVKDTIRVLTRGLDSGDCDDITIVQVQEQMKDLRIIEFIESRTNEQMGQPYGADRKELAERLLVTYRAYPAEKYGIYHRGFCYLIQLLMTLLATDYDN